MLYPIFSVVAVLILIVLALGFSRPATFRVERSISIKAPPAAIYAILSDFRQSECWSPWEKKDLNMKKIFGGPASGKGATYEWDGDKNVGHGRQEIVDVVPNSKIVIQLDFFRPFQGTNTVEFLLEPAGDSTTFRWVMYGPTNFIVRVLCFNMDKMIGTDFEIGLANLKAHLEK